MFIQGHYEKKIQEANISADEKTSIKINHEEDHTPTNYISWNKHLKKKL